ncbi:hypothetical protein RSSM_00506 [Rhodopirellula sallentina SM41]|uniref:Uncharacterized protein n=1 Tax=Rhodopirellula sallentina SM41 TaxID=1263870 RepID=M5UJQ0_9BACT|nr:hypothetical protein RSSM_00506 [Rhodopirellula sallentina SM41]
MSWERKPVLRNGKTVSHCNRQLFAFGKPDATSRASHGCVSSISLRV